MQSTTLSDANFETALNNVFEYLFEKALEGTEDYRKKLADFQQVLRNVDREMDDILLGTESFASFNSRFTSSKGYQNLRDALKGHVIAAEQRKAIVIKVLRQRVNSTRSIPGDKSVEIRLANNLLAHLTETQPVMRFSPPVITGEGDIVTSARKTNMQNTIAIMGRHSGTTQNHSNIHNEVTAWLIDICKQVTDELGGTVKIERSAQNRLAFRVTGNVAMKYSIFSAFRYMQPEAAKTIFCAGNVDNELYFQIDSNVLLKAYRESQHLAAVKQWLNRNSYTTGRADKECAHVFTNDKDFESKNSNALQQRLGIDLVVAEELHHSPGKIILPLQMQVSTFDDDQMETLEGIYRDVGLYGANNEPKRFIDETRGGNLEHKSNLALSQLATLRRHFERLAMFAGMAGKQMATMRETDITAEQRALRGQHLEQIRRETLEWQVEKTRRLTSSTNSSRQQQGLFSLTHTVSTSKSGYTETEFTDEAQEFLNKNVVLGPNAFRLMAKENPLFRDFDSLHPQLEQKDRELRRALVAHHEEYGQVSAKLVNFNAQSRGDSVMLNALVGVANAMEEKPHGINISDLDWLRSSDQENRFAFCQKYSPWWIVDNAISHIKTLLHHPACSNEGVTKILKGLGLTEDEIGSYMMPADTGSFNCYKIEFNLVPIVITSFLRQDVLMPVSQLHAAHHPWAYEPLKRYYVSDPESWFYSMLNWQFNKVYNLGWRPAGPPTTQVNFFSRENGPISRLTDLAGGSSYSNNNSGNRAPSLSGDRSS